MIKEILAGGLTFLAFASPVRGGLEFSTSGVWQEPRIYSESTIATEPLNLKEPYSFKTKLINNSDQQESDYLTAQITGPETFAFDYGLVTIDANKDSIRTRTLSEGFSHPGNYTLTMNLDSGDSISRDFNVIPEPTSLALFGLGAVLLAKRQRK